MGAQLQPIEEKRPSRYEPQDSLAIGLPTPDSLNLMVDLANRIKGTALCPNSIGNNPANMLAVMLRGRELGMQPMESLQCMFVINNKIGMSYDAMLRHMRREGVKLTWKQNDEDGAEIQGETSDGYKAVGRFTADNAKQAGLSGKETYQKYGRRMYAARAVSELYGKIGLGPRMYSPEELVDLPPEEYNGDSIAEAAGTADSKQIDETIILPEDEQRLRKQYEIYDLGPKAATEFLLQVQADAGKSGDPASHAKFCLNNEIARIKNEFHDKEEEKKAKRRGRRKKSATEQASEPAAEQTVNGQAQQAAPEDNPADDEPPPEEGLGVSESDAPETEPVQGSLAGEW